MVVQQLLSDVQAISDLAFGQWTLPNAADSVWESSHGIGRLVGIAEAVRPLAFVVRVGGAHRVDNGSPDQFPGGNILAAVKKFRSQRRQIAGCVQMRQRIQTDGSLGCAVSISSTRNRIDGR